MSRFSLVTDARGIATLTLDRPEVANAYDEDLLRDLTSALQDTAGNDAVRALVHGPKQQGAAAGSLKGRVTIGWGRNDRVTLPSEADTATRAFPDASLHWFSDCGHFPHWEQPEAFAERLSAFLGKND